MIGVRRGDRRARHPRLLRHRLRLRPALPLRAPSAAADHYTRPPMTVLAVFGIDNGGAQPGRQPADPLPGRDLAGARLLDVRGRPPPHRPTRCSSAARPRASLFPFVGTIVYMIVRPPEYLDDVRERELEMQAAEARLHAARLPALPALRRTDREATSCAARAACASSRTRARLRKPLDPQWRICPYCEAEVGGAARRAAAPPAPASEPTHGASRRESNRTLRTREGAPWTGPSSWSSPTRSRAA